MTTRLHQLSLTVGLAAAAVAATVVLQVLGAGSARSEGEPRDAASPGGAATAAPGSGAGAARADGHMGAVPSVHSLGALPAETLSAGLQRQYIHGGQSTFVKWTAKKGAVVPLHHHANEQITWITEGRAEVRSQGKVYILNAGDIMIIPPNVPHEFRFVEDTVDIDIFAPQRQDWIDGTAAYYAKD